MCVYVVGVVQTLSSTSHHAHFHEAISEMTRNRARYQIVAQIAEVGAHMDVK